MGVEFSRNVDPNFESNKTLLILGGIAQGVGVDQQVFNSSTMQDHNGGEFKKWVGNNPHIQLIDTGDYMIATRNCILEDATLGYNTQIIGVHKDGLTVDFSSLFDRNSREYAQQFAISALYVMLGPLHANDETFYAGFDQNNVSLTTRLVIDAVRKANANTLSEVAAELIYADLNLGEFIFHDGQSSKFVQRQRQWELSQNKYPIERSEYQNGAKILYRIERTEEGIVRIPLFVYTPEGVAIDVENIKTLGEEQKLNGKTITNIVDNYRNDQPIWSNKRQKVNEKRRDRHVCPTCVGTGRHSNKKEKSDKPYRVG